MENWLSSPPGTPPGALPNGGCRPGEPLGGVQCGCQSGASSHSGASGPSSSKCSDSHRGGLLLGKRAASRKQRNGGSRTDAKGDGAAKGHVHLEGRSSPDGSWRGAILASSHNINDHDGYGAAAETTWAKQQQRDGDANATIQYSLFAYPLMDNAEGGEGPGASRANTPAFSLA